METTLSPTIETNPVEYRACTVDGEILDREKMSQCGTCGQYVCTQHDCGCPLPGVDVA